MKPDAKDATYICGLALVTVGVAFVYWPAALIVCGAILLITTAAAIRMKG